jgi:hypothetical protein
MFFSGEGSFAQGKHIPAKLIAPTLCDMSAVWLAYAEQAAGHEHEL